MVIVSASQVPQGLPKRDVVVIVLDDAGVDVFRKYNYGGDAGNYSNMPLLDAWTDQGIQFEGAYADPYCTPTRALIQTGQYSVTTGVGHLIGGNTAYTLRSAPPFLSIPAALDSYYSTHPQQSRPYNHGIFGKYHLGNNAEAGAAAYDQCGYDEFRGVLRNLAPSGPNSTGYYQYDWWNVVQGVGESTVQTDYVTSYTVDQFLDWKNSLARGSSYMAMVWFNAPHVPYDGAPAALHSIPGVDENTPYPDDGSDPRPWFDAHMEAMDKEIDRLVRACKACDTTFIVLGDNGSPDAIIGPPFAAGQDKSSVYRGGCQIPMWAWGNSVLAHGVKCHQLIGATDLWPTVLDLCGVDRAALTLPNPIDGVSFASILADPSAPPRREFHLSQTLQPTGLGPYTDEDWRAITDGRQSTRDIGPRWRYLRRQGGTSENPGATVEEFYDLWSDPYEATDLAGSLTPEQQFVFDELSAIMDATIS